MRRDGFGVNLLDIAVRSHFVVDFVGFSHVGVDIAREHAFVVVFIHREVKTADSAKEVNVFHSI
jgi:hypothetical protein